MLVGSRGKNFSIVMDAPPQGFDGWAEEVKIAWITAQVQVAQIQAQVAQAQADSDRSAVRLAQIQRDITSLRNNRSLVNGKFFPSLSIPPALPRRVCLPHPLSRTDPHSSRPPLPHLLLHQHVHFLPFVLYWDSSQRAHQAPIPRNSRQHHRVHLQLRPGLGIRLLFRNRLLRIPRTPDPRMIDSCLLTQYLIMSNGSTFWGDVHGKAIVTM